MVLDSPTLPLDILIDLFRSSDTSLIHTHPSRYQILVRRLIVSQDHTAEFPRFLQNVQFQSSFYVF
jgi:hypothetical protein